MSCSISKYILRICISIVTIIIFIDTSSAQIISDIPVEAEYYERSIKEILNRSTPVSLEAVFEEGLSVAKIITNRSNPSDQRNVLEQFDAAAFEKIKLLMTGFWINRDEVIVAEPDPAFFVKLAEEKGTEVDRIFFEALQKTYPGWFPVYIEQQSDFGGCVVFDGKTISKIYGMWIEFQKKYPERYQYRVQEELKKIEDNITSNCICNSKDDYWKELRNFVDMHPDLPMAASISLRLKTTNSDASNLRFHCKVVAH